MGGRGGSSIASYNEYRDPTADIPSMSVKQLQAEYKTLNEKYRAIDRKQRSKLEDDYIDALNTAIESGDLESKAFFEKDAEKKQKLLDRAKKKNDLSERKFSKIPDDFIRYKGIKNELGK